MMAITANNITKHELIGQTAEIAEAKNKSLEKIKGEIVDESRNTITICHKGKFKRILKSAAKFKFKIKGKTIIIDGKKLIGRPEERIKK